MTQETPEVRRWDKIKSGINTTWQSLKKGSQENPYKTALATVLIITGATPVTWPAALVGGAILGYNTYDGYKKAKEKINPKTSIEPEGKIEKQGILEKVKSRGKTALASVTKGTQENPIKAFAGCILIGVGAGTGFVPLILVGAGIIAYNTRDGYKKIQKAEEGQNPEIPGSTNKEDLKGKAQELKSGISSQAPSSEGQNTEQKPRGLHVPTSIPYQVSGPNQGKEKGNNL